MTIVEMSPNQIQTAETPIIWTESPFISTDPKLIFNPEFLAVMAANPGIIPHQRSEMETHGFIPRKVMRAITTTLVAEPHQVVTRKVTENSFATWFLEQFNASHRAIDLMNLGEEKYAVEVLGEARYRKLKSRSIAETRNIEPEAVTEGMIKEDTLAGIFWLGNTENIIAIRNRIRLVHTALDIVLKEQLEVMGINPSVLEIASGSARPLLQKIAEYSRQGYRDRISALLVDNSRSALKDSLKIAEALRVRVNIDTREKDFHLFKEYTKGFCYTLSEIVGLLDYLPEDEKVTLLAAVGGNLVEGGAVIFSNVTHDPDEERHPESTFREKAVNWPWMVEHTMEEMERIVQRSGFSVQASTFFTEPQGCHILVIARK